MAKELSSVEWLLDWMGKNQYFIGNDLLQAVEKAKEMEKEQIIDAWDDGCYQSSDFPRTSDAERYYNETFKSE